jgi:hypothetical protein
MRRPGIATMCLAGLLVCAGATSSFASKDDPHAASRGVVVTVIAMDPSSTMATLQTQDGALYQLPTETSWKVGDQIECDLMEASLRPEVRLQHCRPWQ